EKRNNQSSVLSIEQFHAETNMSEIDASGKVRNFDKIQYSLGTSLEVETSEFQSYIPDSALQSIDGKIGISLKTKGSLPDSINVKYADYLLKNSELDLDLKGINIQLDSSLAIDSLRGKLTYDLHHVTAQDIALQIPLYDLNITNTSFDTKISGKVSSPSSLGIQTKSFRIETGNSKFYGDIDLQNLETPNYQLNSTLQINLEDFTRMIPGSLLKNVSGGLSVQLSSKGKINPDSISSQINDLVFQSSKVGLTLNDVSLQLPDTSVRIQNTSGKIEMNPSGVSINKCKGVFNGMEFLIDSTVIANLYNTVILNKKEQLKINGRFYLGELNYDMLNILLEGDSTSSSSENEETVSNTPTNNYTYQLKGKLGINSFTYDKAKVEDISALFNLSDTLYIIDQLKFNGFNGHHNTSLRYAINGDKTEIWIKNKADKLDVKQLLVDFDNFKDYYKPEITHENLSGLLSSEVHGYMVMENDSLLVDMLRVKGDIQIVNGIIKNYQPLKDAERVLPPGVGNLDVLEFDTITTNIFILNNSIFVPSTTISSNKLEASALGMKEINGKYSYHFIVYLSELFTGLN
ncbi:MAG: AsmA family protein, partial [Bacteroidales bacterium]|nr:AsmA family protein [Bacteroidales bacterium]